MSDQQHSILRKQQSAQAKNMLAEYSGLLNEIITKIKSELNTEITGTTSDEIALEYKRRQGGREALDLFMVRLNSRSNDRN